ncbi:MAG: DUF2752 domain-containing protein [Defluviitaleaceae bacterium]|nr:DUF2752 domain-containing protein [Defluviitaleaceae bacterium]
MLYAVLGLLFWLAVSAFAGTLCWIQALIGFPCPSCGSTRAAIELVQGNFFTALQWHPLILLSLVLLPYAVFRIATAKHKPLSSVEKYILLGIGALYIVVFIVRMIFLFPHTPPMVMHDGTVIRRIFRLLGLLF